MSDILFEQRTCLVSHLRFTYRFSSIYIEQNTVSRVACVRGHVLANFPCNSSFGSN